MASVVAQSAGVKLNPAAPLRVTKEHFISDLFDLHKTRNPTSCVLEGIMCWYYFS